MNYENFMYLWPPRPEKKIPRDGLKFYGDRGWWAQVKKNGTCTVIFARGNEVIFKTRHDDDHKQWTPLKEHVKFFQSSGKKWNVFVSELVHSKTTHIKNQLYLFDIIVKDGIQLVGKTFEERQHLLFKQFLDAKIPLVEEFDQYRLNEFVSIAKNFDTVDGLWDKLKPEDEGVVMKNPKAKLNPCFKPDSNSSWQVKSRLKTKNYGF